MQAPRWMRFLLIGSLAVNLLVVGLVAGSYFRGGPDGRPNGRGGPAEHGPYAQALDTKHRDAFREELRNRGPKFQANRAELRQSFQAVLEVLRAETLDVEALGAAIERQEAALRGRMAIGSEVMVARIQAMTPEERAAFADRLEQNVRRGGRRPKD